MDEEEALFRAALEEGIRLFDARRFEEAYEVWYARWEEETTDGADLLQGLLQVAFACCKMGEGNGGAALKLLATARDKLLLYAPEAYDVDVDGILGLVAGWEERLRAVQGPPN